MSGVFEGLLRTTLRAEQANPQAMVATYVPVQGVTDALLSSDDHVVVGVRGTGKTHALRYLAAKIADDGLGIPVRSDLRMMWDDPFPLGDPPQLTTQRARSVVSAVLEDIIAQVSEVLTAPGAPAIAVGAAEAVDELSEAVALATTRPTEGTAGDVWGRVAQSIDALAARLPGGRIWLLIDEWDSLEGEIVGDVASLLTRVAHDCASLTVKCTADATRRERTPALPGARLDLDEALAFERSPGDGEKFCEELLFRRIRLETADLDRSVLPRAIFADQDTARTLVLASHGVPRELLNLATLAASCGEGRAISTAGVFRAAEESYARDKRPMLPPYLETDLVLRWVYEQGEDNGRPRTFSLSDFAGRSPLIGALEAHRVLRRVRSPADGDIAPEAVRAYRMDVGCYRVLRSRNGPEPEAISRPAPQGTLTPDVIHMFERLLDEQHPEEVYQAFLTKHPILLEPHASEIHPKLRLGAEHVTDFAIRAHDGRWLLVEIEKPQDRPLTRGNDLSSAFTHGFGQVIDWLTWVDQNVAYAQRTMPGIAGARGRLIMGRRSHMTPKAEAKVRTFCVHNAAVEWVAFDDLAAGARTLYRNMHGVDVPGPD